MRRVLLSLAICVAFAGCTRSPTLELSGPTMGTTYSVKVVEPPVDVDAARLRATIDAVLAKIDGDMSTYRPDSVVSRFNASRTTEWFEVTPDVARVVESALEVSAASGGAFDITVAPLVNAWGFGPDGEPARMPDAAELAALRERVGYRHLRVRMQPPALRKAVPALALDLNGIAPGYAVDRLADAFAAIGVRHYLIDIGGEVRASGRNAEGRAWRVAIERPENGAPMPYAIVALDDLAITTSGEYRHYVERDGQRYSHTIDPHAGAPVSHTLASVVVAGASATQNDAWSTALNVLGPEAGYALADHLGMRAMFIEWHGRELRARQTPAFTPLLAVSPTATK